MSGGHRIRVGRHVLGSTKGYTTLAASPDLTADEIALLETLGFGQTDDEEFLQSLHNLPAGMGRPLPGGRYALTRCLPGPLDTANRRTLVFTSLVFSTEDWCGYAAYSALSLLDDASLWSFVTNKELGTVFINCAPATKDEMHRERTLAVLDAWLVARRSGALVVAQDSAVDAVCVSSLARLLPKKQRCKIRWGMRVLSGGAPIDIGTFAKGAAMPSRRRVVRPHEGGDHREVYTQALAGHWARGSSPPRRFCDGVENVDALSAPEEDESDVVPASGPDARRTSRPMVIGSVAVMTLLTFTLGVVLLRRGENHGKLASGMPDKSISSPVIKMPRAAIGKDAHEAVTPDSKTVLKGDALSRSISQADPHLDDRKIHQPLSAEGESSLIDKITRLVDVYAREHAGWSARGLERWLKEAERLEKEAEHLDLIASTLADANDAVMKLKQPLAAVRAADAWRIIDVNPWKTKAQRTFVERWPNKETALTKLMSLKKVWELRNEIQQGANLTKDPRAAPYPQFVRNMVGVTLDQLRAIDYHQKELISNAINQGLHTLQRSWKAPALRFLSVFAPEGKREVQARRKPQWKQSKVRRPIVAEGAGNAPGGADVQVSLLEAAAERSPVARCVLWLLRWSDKPLQSINGNDEGWAKLGEAVRSARQRRASSPTRNKVDEQRDKALDDPHARHGETLLKEAEQYLRQGIAETNESPPSISKLETWSDLASKEDGKQKRIFTRAVSKGLQTHLHRIEDKLDRINDDLNSNKASPFWKEKIISEMTERIKQVKIDLERLEGLAGDDKNVKSQIYRLRKKFGETKDRIAKVSEENGS